MATKTISSENLNKTYLSSSDTFSMGNSKYPKQQEVEVGTNKTSFFKNSCEQDQCLPVDYVTQVASKISTELVLADSSSTPPPSHGTNTVVVIPSMDFDEVELQRINKVVGFYEERQLYHLFLLQDPSYRVVYLSSHPISQDVVRYFVSLNCRYESEVDERLSRLSLLTIRSTDSSYKSLCVKVCQSQEWVRLIANEIRHLPCPIETTMFHRTGLSVFTGSQTADQLAHLLGIRLLEAGYESTYYGTKQGSREIFKSCDIPLSPGTPDMELGDDDLLTPGTTGSGYMAHLRFIRTPHDLAKGLARQILLRNIRPSLWILKLNQGFSGKGNAFLDLKTVQESKVYGSVDINDRVNQMSKDIMDILPKLHFVCPSMTWDGCDNHVGFKTQMLRLGVIAEVYIDNSKASPSVQALIEPIAKSEEEEVMILSTHEQILNGQVFEGCRNPSAFVYRNKLVNYTKKIGYALMNRGVLGHFAIDYLVSTVCDDNGETIVTGIEINLRQGGTTHPFATMALLCGGTVDQQGIFRTGEGHLRCYVATDNYYDEGLKLISVDRFLCHLQEEAALLHPTRWDLDRKIGVIFHMVGFLQHGKLGFTAIGSSSTEAQKLFDDTTSFLRRVAGISRTRSM